jgi:hypothetical protein
MADVAVTNIDTGSRIIPAGSRVTAGDDLDADTIKHLKEIGSIAEPSDVSAEEIENKDAQIAELQAQLEELKKSRGTFKADEDEQTPAGTTTPPTDDDDKVDVKDKAQASGSPEKPGQTGAAKATATKTAASGTK